jgi:hypothetical protein
LASRNSSNLRIVCPFAKEHLARHPELKDVSIAVTSRACSARLSQSPITPVKRTRLQRLNKVIISYASSPRHIALTSSNAVVFSSNQGAMRESS